MSTSSLLLLGTTFLFGMRHGVDWDHLAAITDIVGSTHKKKEAIINSLFYILGHAFIIILLGTAAIVFGLTLPRWVDKYMTIVVGITLILLGIVLLISIIRNKHDFKIQSRWSFLFQSLKKITSRISIRHRHVKSKSDEPLSKKAILGIGMLHGIGAETPTQVLLFLSIGGMEHSLMALLLLLLFVFGLMISNFVISILAMYGFSQQNKRSSLYTYFGIVLAVFNIGIGLLFTFGLDNKLPEIFR